MEASSNNKTEDLSQAENIFEQNQNECLINFCINFYYSLLGTAVFLASEQNPDSSESEEESQVCQICYADFSCKKGLSQHIGKVHSKSDKTALCAKCGKYFKNENALKSHVKQVHDKITRVPCKKCGKLIYNKYMMKAHMAREHPAQTNIS
ncbi:unnamed protein product [Blepharisma stoltei]|uniref:C2H2-type domain-containing protein n=1 Tax=Blepharisma stoltei TaxID=1481888 RepID=A0AAU9JVM6_9CILI|nr:unnamed protein product [Blepharisma stoltei]